MDWDMARTKELPLIPVVEPLLEDDLERRSGASSFDQLHTYTVTFSFSFGSVMGLSDTVVGIVVLRIVSIVIAAGGFIISLSVILLAPYFPSLVSAAPALTANSRSTPRGASSPYGRHSPPHPRPAPVTVQVTVRRDPTITPIIEIRDSASPSPAPVNRRVSFSPQSSSTSVPIAADVPSAPGSSTGHCQTMASPGSSMRSIRDRVREREREPGYILPTPPSSIASVSSEADDTETLDEFGSVNASPGVGKRGRGFPFVGRRKDKGKEVVRDGIDGQAEFGLFGSRKRSQSLGYVVEGNMSGLSRAKTTGGIASSPLSRARLAEERVGSQLDEPLRETGAETSSRGADKEERASRSTVEKEARRRSGLSFQDFKAAFGKRERRGSAHGAYALSPTSPGTTPTTPENGPGGVPRASHPHFTLGFGRPSSVQISPRASSDSATSVRRRSMPLKLDTADLNPGTPADSERAEAQSPLQHRKLFGAGEVVIRNESGRRRTRSSAVPGLYADAEVLQRL
ncbi:hypothetical protein FRC08_005601 [Ceratobasidium sp. 394]|nr:hypothetical protein FRC08_005601 [Ceratobasidium sp. 394]